MIEYRNGRKLGKIRREMLKYIYREIGIRIDKVTSKRVNVEYI